MSGEVGYSPMDLKFLNNMCNCSHRNIKLLGNGLITFTFNMLVYNFLSNLLRQLFPFINGQFRCDWCEFTTFDAGTFVQHIHHHNESHWKCSKCKHISLNEDDHQNHTKAHLGTFPFTCLICGYGAARKEHLKKHTAAVHKEEAERRKITEDSGSSQETQRMPKLNYLSGNVPNQNGRIINHELSSEETHDFLDMTAANKDNINWSRNSQNTEMSAPVMLQESDNPCSDIESHGNANGLTVLMVKNKISLPPNCTTKVMGFKMVDGKKHLVLKVIPVAKQDLPAQNHSIADGAGLLVPNSVMAESKVPAANGQFSDCKSSTSQCMAGSPNIQMDHDSILAVKVKIEEEETSVCDSAPHMDIVGDQTNLFPNKSLTCPDTLCPVTNEFNIVGNQNQVDETTCTGGHKWDKSSVTATFKLNATSHRSKISNGTTVCEDNVTSLLCPSNVAQTALLSEKTVENCKTINESSLTGCEDGVRKKKKENFVFNTIDIDSTELSSVITPERNYSTNIRPEKKNCLQNVKHLEPPSQAFSVSSRAETSCTGKSTQNTPNQEVFTFHNYSKETFSTSPSTNQNSEIDSNYQGNTCESSQFSLTLAESPEHFTESTCGEGRVDECVTNVDHLLTEENPESVLQDFNIIKIEEDSIPIFSKLPETKSNSTSIGNFVKEHSNAIVTQLDKERTKSSSTSNDSLKQTNTLKLFQLPEGKQPVILKATEKKLTMPVQVKAAPGFKLITSSSDPQINLTYMKRGVDKPSNTTCVTPSPHTKIISVPSANPRAAENGTTMFSAVQPSLSSTSSHYLINSQGFTGPVILSSTLQSAPADKMAKTQSTCYLVQRSVPFVQKPSTSSVKLGSTQLSVSSRPVLAMPVNSTGKSKTLQTGHQAFLLRYISPPKSDLFLNNQEAKTGTLHSQTNESSGNKVIFKIVAPNGGLLSSGASTTTNQPLFLATRPQTQCFLVSQNRTNATTSSELKNLISTKNIPQKNVKSDILPSCFNGKLQPCDADRLLLAPRPIRPPSQRKRHRKALFDELPATVHKARRLSGKVQTTKEIILWKPVAKEVERTLRLAPFSSLQQIKCPRRYQPVVVLNHPDADIPEVANIMKAVNKYKGAVSKVSLSQKTVQALSDFTELGNNALERFLLKMKLRKKSKRKYKIVKTLSACRRGSLVFDCWFCGRLFNNQEDWIGHGQRHLMEATRDWNKLFLTTWKGKSR
uniref:Si:ch211-214e3.5 n=1 Tax=Kryptolebias marmoratus TaxID=37003 RepID=A0A3Q3A9L5_KRYMA